MKTKRTLFALAAAALVASTVSMQTLAQDSTSASAAASQAAIAGSGAVVDGSANLLRAGGMFVVAGVAAAGDASVILLRDAASGSEASIRVAEDVTRAGSVAVGQTVTVVAETAGLSLIAGGRFVAFIPNEVARAMIYTARSTQM
ncbi:MAG TPA: hypothetical protein VLG08_04145 [Casimicrobiaceae bacterium]|jgi:hypothetical protein|nr:hypothetical protein [Casimicrobiaceae bacterium]